MNISDLLTAYLESKRDNDEDRQSASLHVSDVANGCTRATWHRMRFGAHKVYDGLALKKFEYGHRYEAFVKDALAWAGYELITDELIEVDGLVGHPDILAVNHDASHLIEVKTTLLFRNGYGPPKMYTIDEIREKQTQYIIQAAIYAHHYGCERFTVHLSDRGTGQDGDYEFVTAVEWPAVRARIAAFRLSVTGNDEPEPEVPQWTRNAKGVSYLCRGCAVTSCSQNSAYAPPRAEKVTI